ncbi:cell division protein FtsQ/DivIB [Moraxella sp. ZY210820]|uniref:cell division protein FtsQ/DivIB n=1 Tax=unclassified Moraxella TaxID=2685852 RepID=UPI00272F59A6|nr:cell division protein FtsQ/DivIB [Moraxella sp. ZY210820]WLF83879.1 cell division protein FtsQ/DivIB [Moraxella sp. ZY210820]
MFKLRKRSEENQAISTFEEIEIQQQQNTKSLLNWLFVVVSVLLFFLSIYAFTKMFERGKHIQYQVLGAPTAQAKQNLEQQIQDLQQSHYLTADMMQIRDTVLKQQWVDEVVVSRLWPNQITVKVTPRQAVARWGKAGRWVNEQGEIFSLYQENPNHRLVTLSGPNDQAKQIMQIYRDVDQLFKPIDIRLVDVHLTDRMTWLLQFDSGLRIVVDQDNTMLKLQQLSTIARRDLKPIWSRIAGFDLRYRDGLAIQWKTGQAVPVSKGKFLIPSS